MSRTEQMTMVTRRLIVMTAVAVLLLGAIFGVSFFLSQRVMMTWIGFLCAIIGGFVSIQQRLPTVTDEELELLTRSWFQILLIPIFGGVFSLVLYVIFLSGIITGDLFPAFSMPSPPDTGPDTQFMVDILTKTYPASGPDFAKFLFWSFVAGFSERFVPQIITKVTSGVTEAQPPHDDRGPSPPPGSPPGNP